MDTTTRTTSPAHKAMRGFLAGFLPLGMLLGTLLVTLVVTWVVRMLLSAADFSAQQTVFALVFGLGLLAATITYVAAMVRTVRRARRWQTTGEAERARGSWWALALTGILVVLPVILAVALPQSPAVAK